MATGELRQLYFALNYETKELIGWDTVTDDQVSKYQRMLGERDKDVFVVDLRWPGNPIYIWTASGGWDAADQKCKEYLPKEVQMQLLTGAL